MKREISYGFSVFFKSLTICLFSAVLIMSPLLFRVEEAAVDRDLGSIPYTESTISISLNLDFVPIFSAIEFSPATGSLKVSVFESEIAQTTHRKLTLTKENITQIVNKIGGVTLTTPVVFSYPGNGEDFKTSDPIHLFGNDSVKFLENYSKNSLKAVGEFLGNLVAKYIKNFTKEKYYYIAECETNISYADYYDHKEKLESCAENIIF